MEQPASTPQMQTQPEITFFVESREESAEAIKQNRASSRGDFLLKQIGEWRTRSALQTEVRGRIALALTPDEIDKDPAILELIKEFGVARIGVDIWPNLSDKTGYWLHAGNIEQARAEILEMMNALERRHAAFQNVGLDLEMPKQLAEKGNFLQGLTTTRPFGFSQRAAKDSLRALIEEILDDKRHGVNTYEIPLLGDSPAARKLLGIPQAPKQEEICAKAGNYKRVAMVYTSVKPNAKLFGGAPENFIKRYSARLGRVPALGIVSGTGASPGRDISFPKLLTQAEFERDMAAALEVSPGEVFVFALNGIGVIQRTRTAIEKALSGAGTRT